MEKKKVEITENEQNEGVFKKIKRKVSERLSKIGTYLSENPQVTLPLLSGVGMLLGGGVKLIAGAGKTQTEHCRVRDDITDEYYLTEHPLTNDEILELSKRMSLGQPKGVALREMGLLRKEKKRK